MTTSIPLDRQVAASWPEWRCTVHRHALHAEGDVLHCPEGCTFRFRNGIPRFVPASSYSAAFGLQWNRYRRTQLDSYTGSPISRTRLRRCLGEALWSRLRGASVLEAGCGAGRFTEVLLQEGARVTSIDLSEAVEANQQNFPQDASHRIAQADLTRLPFAPRSFDVVLCLGVLQHTPDPEQSIAALYEQVAPGGWLVIDHYAYTLSRFTKLSRLYREVLRRLPPERGLRWTEALVDAFLPLHRAVRRVPLAQMALSRVSPVICYYRHYPELGDELQREWALLDTHDTLTDWFKHLRSPAQIRGTLTELGLESVWCEKRGSVVEARGRRPAQA